MFSQTFFIFLDLYCLISQLFFASLLLKLCWGHDLRDGKMVQYIVLEQLCSHLFPPGHFCIPRMAAVNALGTPVGVVLGAVPLDVFFSKLVYLAVNTFISFLCHQRHGKLADKTRYPFILVGRSG
jgi:hypothetical protein